MPVEKIVSVVGYHKARKTTIELIPELQRREYV